jgi:YD repeat-containing protein
MEYDSRGRVVERIEAAGTAVAATSQTLYDDQSNVIEQRSPRYFDSADALGYQKAYTTMTYTGRNLLASRTVAAGDSTYNQFITSGGTTGKGAKATEEFYYYLDGRHAKTVDFNGNDPSSPPPNMNG